MAHLRSSLAVLSLTGLLALAAGCGEPPQKIPKPTAGTPAAAQAPAAPTTPMKFAGELTLAGSLAKAGTGSVFVIVRQPGSRMPTLARKYELGDPAWAVRGEQRVLTFALDETYNMGGAAAPGGEQMELEARFDPDGLIETKTGNESGVVQVRPGATDIAVTLRAAADAGSGAGD